MKKIKTVNIINNMNSPKNLKLYNNYYNTNDSNSPSLLQSQVIIDEMQSSIDSIINNLKNNSNGINIQTFPNYKNKSYIYKTPNNIPSKKIYNNIPEITDYCYKTNENKNIFNKENNTNNNLFRNYSDYKIKNRIIHKNDEYFNKMRNNINTEYNINNDNNYKNKNKIIDSIHRKLNLLKKNNYINKNEIMTFQKEYCEMKKFIIKGIETYLKVFNNNYNIKIKELEQNLNIYKNKYYRILNSNICPKEKNSKKIIINEEKEIIYNKNISETENNIDIQKLKNKYDIIIQQKNEKINDLNLEILKLNLEKKKLRHQKLKQYIEALNLNIKNICNNKKTKEKAFKNDETNLLKHKSFDNKKKQNLKINKTPTKINASDNNTNLSYDEILSENKKLKSQIIILQSKSNNFVKLYSKYKEISDKLYSENEKLVKERDEFKKKKAELNNEIEIIKINNDRMNNIKIKNNYLINNNLTIKSKINNFKEKENDGGSYNKINVNTKHNKENKENNNQKQMQMQTYLKRSISVKNKIKLNKENIKDMPEKHVMNNLNVKKFSNLKNISKEIQIYFKAEKISNINKENINVELKNKINDIKLLEQENNKNKIIIDGLKSQIKKMEQTICKYELEKQIEEKKKKKISESNTYQINGLNELIKLLKDKNQKLNLEIEKLRNKNDDRVIDLVKELNLKDKEISSLIGKINKLKKELNNNGIPIPNIEN